MSSEIIERVARAIYEGRNGPGCRAWGSQPASHQEPYLKDARAAIEAMREPTEAMLDAGKWVSPLYDDPTPAAVEYWETMIEAALTSPSEPGKETA